MSKTLKHLSVEHPYYCSGSNYFSNEANEVYESMTDFLEMYGNADIDMNLIFRWDITWDEEIGEYTAYVFIMKQRKGIFSPCEIKSISEKEAKEFEVIAKKHWLKLIELWEPISNIINHD